MNISYSYKEFTQSHLMMKSLKNGILILIKNTINLIQLMSKLMNKKKLLLQ